MLAVTLAQNQSGNGRPRGTPLSPPWAADLGINRAAVICFTGIDLRMEEVARSIDLDDDAAFNHRPLAVIPCSCTACLLSFSENGPSLVVRGSDISRAAMRPLEARPGAARAACLGDWDDDRRDDMWRELGRDSRWREKRREDLRARLERREGMVSERMKASSSTIEPPPATVLWVGLCAGAHTSCERREQHKHVMRSHVLGESGGDTFTRQQDDSEEELEVLVVVFLVQEAPEQLDMGVRSIVRNALHQRLHVFVRDPAHTHNTVSPPQTSAATQAYGAAYLGRP